MTLPSYNTSTCQSLSSDDHLELNYDYSMKDFMKEAGDEKFINIFLNKVMINSMVKELNRQIPYAFKFNINNEQRYPVRNSRELQSNLCSK